MPVRRYPGNNLIIPSIYANLDQLRAIEVDPSFTEHIFGYHGPIGFRELELLSRCSNLRSLNFKVTNFECNLQDIVDRLLRPQHIKLKEFIINYPVAHFTEFPGINTAATRLSLAPLIQAIKEGLCVNLRLCRLTSFTQTVGSGFTVMVRYGISEQEALSLSDLCSSNRIRCCVDILEGESAYGPGGRHQLIKDNKPLFSRHFLY